MRRKAFTLIELLVAIAIIMILAALLIPAIQKIRHRNDNKTTQVVNSSDPRQSPLTPAKQAEVAYTGFTLQINDLAQVQQVIDLLKANGYQVEPVTDKSSLVFKPQ